MSRQLRKIFFFTAWLTAMHTAVPAQEAGGEDSYWIDPGLPSVRHVPDSVADSLKAQEEFLYANDPAFWEKKEQRDSALARAGASFLNSPVLKIVLYVLLAFLIGFVLYQLIVVNNLFVLRRSRGKRRDGGSGEEELFSGDLDQRISGAVAAGEYRQAIRYYYLRTLRFLHDRHMIQLDARSTNYDYLAQMKGQDAEAAFADLTSIYEYVWYGQHQPDARQFEKIRSGFKRFIATG